MGVGQCGLGLWLSLAAACASHQPSTLAGHFIHHADRSGSSAAPSAEPDPFRVTTTEQQGTAAPQQGTATNEAPARNAVTARNAVPVKIESKLSDLPTIEQQDEPLKAALTALVSDPSASAHCQVASEYLRLHIFDDAYDHYRLALKIDPQNAVAYDGLARLWRDAGFLEMSVSEAARAIYYAPKWAEPHNTLGTILYALGNPSEAEREFRTALSLDPEAGYVLNNLCYVSFVSGDLSRALQQCGEAVRLSPELAVARVNLAAVTAAAGK